MRPTLSRALVVCAALLAGGASVTAWYARSPAFVVDLERETPPVVTGLYRSERAGPLVFAWTWAGVDVSLPGVDRRTPWTCALRVRGARPGGVAPPDLALAVDGVTVDHRRLDNAAFADVTVTAPARTDAEGLRLAATVTPAFVPGPADRRPLGAQLTALSCTPTAAVAPPAHAVIAGAAAVALVALALVLMGLPLAACVAGAVVLAVPIGFALALGSGPYGPFSRTVVIAAAAVSTAMASTVWLARAWRGAAVSRATCAAVAISGGLLLVEALGLLHPSKMLVDAVFHAHRLEWVMDGRFFFTQPMPSGVRFPYAIALYVVSTPLGWVFADRVAVLQMVVLASRALAGLAVYVVVARAWNDRGAGVVAVALFHFVPLPFEVLGYANLTYAFGQSVAVAAVVVAALVGSSPGGLRAFAAVFAVSALAFLSHVGIFPLLFAVLLAAAAGFRWFGATVHRRAGSIVATGAVLAAVFSVVVYYGHFAEAYRTLARVRAHAPQESAVAAPAPSTGATRPVRALSLGERLASAGHLARQSFGWPLLALGLAGTIGRWSRGWRDSLGIAVAALSIAAVVFVAGSIVAPIEPAFWRYTAEFISRVCFLAMPAVVVLAADAVVRAWRAGTAGRVVAGVGVLVVAWQAALAWVRWLA